jgi:hypothetical protein
MSRVVGFSIVTRGGVVAALDLFQGAPPGTTAARPLAVAEPDGSPSVAGALGALLEDAREGRVSAESPGDRWLVVRIEEALTGFDDIQQMAAGDEPLSPSRAGGPAGRASIRVRGVGTLTPA